MAKIALVYYIDISYNIPAFRNRTISYNYIMENDIKRIAKSLITRLDHIENNITGLTEARSEIKELIDLIQGAIPIPSVSVLKAAKKDQLLKAAADLNMDTSGMDLKTLRKYLIALSNIANGDDHGLTQKELKAVAKALSLTFSKASEAETAILELFDQSESDDAEEDEEEEDDESEEDEEEESDEEDEESDDEDEESEEDEDEEDDEEDDEEEEDEEPEDDDLEDEEDEESEEEDDEEDDEDEDEGDEEEAEEGELAYDPAELVAEVELPDLATMKEQLAAYNEVAETPIKVGKGAAKVKSAYQELLTEMATDSEEIAEWSEPYWHGDQARCCGVLMADEDEDKGIVKCVVTNELYVVDKQGNFKPHKKAAPKKKAAAKKKRK